MIGSVHAVVSIILLVTKNVIDVVTEALQLHSQDGFGTHLVQVKIIMTIRDQQMCVMFVLTKSQTRLGLIMFARRWSGMVENGQDAMKVQLKLLLEAWRLGWTVEQWGMEEVHLARRDPCRPSLTL